MSKKKRPALDPNVHEKLILDLGLYENMVRKDKLQQMGNIELTAQEFIGTVNACINEILGNILATLLENNVNNDGIKKCMDIYEHALNRVRDEKTPPPPPKLVVDNDEKEGIIMGEVKNDNAPPKPVAVVDKKGSWGIGQYVVSGLALGGTILGAYFVKQRMDEKAEAMGRLEDNEYDDMY